MIATCLRGNDPVEDTASSPIVTDEIVDSCLRGNDPVEDTASSPIVTDEIVDSSLRGNDPVEDTARHSSKTRSRCGWQVSEATIR